ncbi:hypothetical protein Sar04_31610 [Salinispora arenicola]|uniref:Transcriptional regulator n=2 Tax=Salinispora arenicola TaxID=168697 RepID=A0A542XH56_SALAC|nr:hypothetical protein FB564_0176 [Salinispora arenicola]GIM86425.1 hypothetical protein Sar04_31610 [Salinispora arenicola]
MSMRESVRRTVVTAPRRHPLAVLRAKAGHTHGEYARLIAETHATLGFGHMAARREKVSRWEAGRAIPERTAQLAIAHIHGVAQEHVDNRAWPEWLHLAYGDARQLELPWTPAAAPEAILDAVAERQQAQQGYLLATGPAAKSLAENWQDAMTEALTKVPQHLPRPGRVPLMWQRGTDAELGSVLQACTRLRTLLTFAGWFTAGWLVPASEQELRHVANHFATTTDVIAEKSRGLLTLAAEGLSLCGFIARLEGEHVSAQRYYVAGLRCATAAGAAELAAAIMTIHAAQYLDLGLHEEATELLTSAQTFLRRSRIPVRDPALPTLMHAQIARVHAQLGDDLGRRRSLSAGRNALESVPYGDPMAILPARGSCWLQLMDGVSLLELGRPDQAVKAFDPLFSKHVPELNLPPSVRSLYLLRAAEAQAAVGDTVGSVESVAQATTLLGGVRVAVSKHVQLALRAYQHLPEVKALLSASD